MFDEERLDIIRKKVLSERRIKDSEDRKVVDEVFDKATLLTLYDMLKHRRIRSVEFPISTGKEGNVFLALDNAGSPVAVKIYRTTNADFKNMTEYIMGDPRFEGISHNKKKLIHAWCRKEFKNLQRYTSAGLPVPRPHFHQANILVMEYIGDDIAPAPSMKVSPPSDIGQAKEWKRILIDFIVRGYNDAGLVHADLSEYNVLIHRGCPVVIDVAQGVLKSHVNARRFLERDLDRVLKYFEKVGVKPETGEKEEILSRLKEDE